MLGRRREAGARTLTVTPASWTGTWVYLRNSYTGKALRGRWPRTPFLASPSWEQYTAVACAAMNVSRSHIAHEFGVVYSNPCPAELIVIDLKISPMAAQIHNRRKLAMYIF